MVELVSVGLSPDLQLDRKNIFPLKDIIFPPNSPNRFLAGASGVLDEFIGDRLVGFENGSFPWEILYLQKMMEYWRNIKQELKKESFGNWQVKARLVREKRLHPLWVGVFEKWDNDLYKENGIPPESLITVALYLEEGIIWQKISRGLKKEYLRKHLRVELGITALPRDFSIAELYLYFSSRKGELGKTGYNTERQVYLRHLLGILSLEEAQETLKEYRSQLLKAGGVIETNGDH